MAKVPWLKFSSTYSKVYFGCVLFSKGLPKGLPATKIVNPRIASLVQREWASKVIREDGRIAVLLTFETKADFDAVKLALDGKPWRSVFKAEIEAFQTIL